jgi:hypothetical protein
VCAHAGDNFGPGERFCDVVHTAGGEPPDFGGNVIIGGDKKDRRSGDRRKIRAKVKAIAVWKMHIKKNQGDRPGTDQRFRAGQMMGARCFKSSPPKQPLEDLRCGQVVIHDQHQG